MKRTYVTIILLSIINTAFAQQTIRIDLADWKGKTEKTPFHIKSVADLRATPDQIGLINISKNKEKAIEFASKSSAMMQQFIDLNFEPENEMDIRLDIEQLDIQETQIKGKKKITAFVFACKFYKLDGTNKEALYSFNARNSIPKKNNLQVAMTNYIGRALQAAVINFKKSYKKHPEWKGDNKTTPNVELKKKISFNQFLGGDTIGLSGDYKLMPSDFAGIVGEEEKDNAYSFFIMTYTLEATDEDNSIAIHVAPKAYFLRSKSWAKKTETNEWLAYQQLLFDLASHHALLFKKQLESQDFSAGFYKAEINNIYNKTSENYFDEMDTMQAETQYGSNEEKTKTWRKKVDAYLKK